MSSRYSWWQVCLVALAIGASSAVPVLAARGQLDFRASPTFSDFVQAASVLVSWPVAITLITLRFMARFSGAIDSYLRGLGHIKLPGGVELQSSQAASATEPNDPNPGSLVLSPQQQDEIRNAIQDIEQQRQLSDEQRATVEQEFKQMADLAIQWKFNYLNLFFVPSTKNVLHWFSNTSPQSRATYETTWSSIITDQAQREVILNVLLHYGFVTESDGLIRIAPHGYSFLQFIGMIPPTPPAAG